MCSASLLSAEQGTLEAADAVAQLKANGFPDRTIVFLDVEFVTLGYADAARRTIASWITGIIRDGHYRVGIYAAKSNATTLYVAALDAARRAGSSEQPGILDCGQQRLFARTSADRGGSRLREAVAGDVRRHPNLEWQDVAHRRRRRVEPVTERAVKKRTRSSRGAE